MTVLLVRNDTTLRPSFDPRHWGSLLRDTVVFALAVAVNSLYFRVTLVIMTLLATAEETGYFAISFRVMEVLVSVPLLLIGAAFPIVARAARTDQQRFAFASGGCSSSRLRRRARDAVLDARGAVRDRVLAGEDDHPSVGRPPDPERGDTRELRRGRRHVPAARYAAPP